MISLLFLSNTKNTSVKIPKVKSNASVQNTSWVEETPAWLWVPPLNTTESGDPSMCPFQPRVYSKWKAPEEMTLWHSRPPATPPPHMGPHMSPGCSTSGPALFLRPGEAVENGSGPWALHSHGRARRKPCFPTSDQHQLLTSFGE